MIVLLVFILFVSPAFAGSISDIPKAEPEAPRIVPEPDAVNGCPIPPIPQDMRAIEGEGYSVNHEIAWQNFILGGMRYYIEYQLLRKNENGSIRTRPFPSLYMLDMNRDGVFNIPGEAWMDAKGDGRCADLVPVPAPVEGEPKKPLA